MHKIKSKKFNQWLLITFFTVSSLAYAEQIQTKVVDLSESKLIAVKTSSSNPSAYAEAFGKLVGYYAQTASNVKIKFPQQSISLNGASYSAIEFSGSVTPPAGIEVITLPKCKFISASYIGGYEGISPLIDTIIGQAINSGKKINHSCGIRIHHLNSPDDTSISKLKHIVFIPI